MLSLPLVNWVALTSIASGASDPELTAIAELGAGGLHPGNMRRDLYRRFCNRKRIANPIPIAVPALDKLGRREHVDQHCLSLPEMLENLWEHHNDHLEDLLGTNPRGFWEALDENDPNYRRWEK